MFRFLRHEDLLKRIEIECKIVCFFPGIGFYANRSANRNLTPAESRDLNVECALLDFYDSHDLWHFFSAAGIFMALLNIDDDILFVPRDKIEIF